VTLHSIEASQFSSHAQGCRLLERVKRSTFFGIRRMEARFEQQQLGFARSRNGSLGFLRALVVSLRALVILMALQVSGVAAVAEQFAGSVETTAGCCTDCPMEQDGRECPPGCPNCHCSHGSVALPSVGKAQLTHAVDLPCRVAVTPHEATAPRAPRLRGVYRPPRHVAAFA
jgi:hypothetical protein